MTGISDSITKAVSNFYEKHPYPNYPLLARPRIEDGYLTSSGFAKCLQFSWSPNSRSDRVENDQGGNILLAGCGEILPYVIRRNESLSSHILAVDLSAQSLRRARFRLGLHGRNIEFRQQDIVETLKLSEKIGEQFCHVDAYGVLHHLADPSIAVTRIAKSLAPDGTVRLMVYNSYARGWIHQFQHIFQLMKFDNFQQRDYKQALQFVNDACDISPHLRASFASIGLFTLNNRSRFCDTFLHVREARISFERWMAIFREAGLQPFALFDRYGELDDLANPLWKMPSETEILERIADKRFENNFEIFLCHTSMPGGELKAFRNHDEALKNPSAPSHLSVPVPTLFGRFPHNWATFAETRKVRPALLRALWKLHQLYTQRHRDDFFDELLIRQFPPDAIRRLARIGAILPQMVHTDEFRNLARSPITDQMEVPMKGDHQQAFPEKMRVLVTKVLLDRNIFSEKVLGMILPRLQRASAG